MSADVWAVLPECEHCGRGEDTCFDFNLTYNLSPMLWAAGMPAWGEMMGMPSREAALIWEAVVEELRSDPDRYEALNPDNGWGSYDQAVKVLEDAARNFATAPEKSVVGGWL